MRLHGPLIQMVVPQQMQHGVYRQIRQFPPAAVPILPRLGLYPLHGDDHVPQGDQPCGRVEQILIFRTGRLTRRKCKHGEAQHVRGPVHLTHLQIDPMDAAVVRQPHVYLTGDCYPLRRQGRTDGFPNQRLDPVAGAGHVRRHGDVVSFCHASPLFLAAAILVVVIVCLDNALHHHVPHHVLICQLADADALHVLQHPDGLLQPGGLVRRQVDLGHVPGDNHP